MNDCAICGQAYHRHPEVSGFRMCPVSAVSYRPKQPTAADERAAIVAWLRRGSKRLQYLADAIERGEHINTAEGK